MKLVIISLVLFFSMKLIYVNWGDYTSYYWNVVYYSSLYFMLASLLRFAAIMAFTKLQRQFFALGCLYFTVMLAVHLLCFFKIDLYVRLIVDVGKITIGSVVIAFGLLAINYFRIRNYDTKSQRKIS